MSNSINQELLILENTKSQLKASIQNKGQIIEDNDSFSSYADKINNIITVKEGTSDATATSSDIAFGKTAYINGQKIEGSLIDNDTQITLDTQDDMIVKIADTYLDVHTNIGTDTIVRASNEISIRPDLAHVAEAIELTPDKIAEGNTILGIEGTYKGSGIDTSDATAMSNDIVEGKIAYVNGKKVEGSLPILHYGISYFEGGLNTIEYREQNGEMMLYTTNRMDQRTAIEQDRDIGHYVTATKLAQVIGLTADVIKKGVTILGITGTYEPTVTTDA